MMLNVLQSNRIASIVVFVMGPTLPFKSSNGTNQSQERGEESASQAMFFPNVEVLGIRGAMSFMVFSLAPQGVQAVLQTGVTHVDDIVHAQHRQGEWSVTRCWSMT